MTTELRQAIELLQLSGAELLDMVERELGENPCLEREERELAATADGRDEGEWGSGESLDIRDEGYAGVSGSGSGGSVDEDGEGWQARASKGVSLQEFVLRQFEQIVRDVKLRMAGRYLIDEMDDAGYIRVDLREAAARLRLHEDVLDDARAILQTLEPAGIGAASLSECLRLQMHARGRLDSVAEFCLTRLDLVAAGSYAEIAALCKLDGCDEEEVRLAVEDIRLCNPKPGLGFGEAKVEVVVPEVIVSKTTGIEGWKVELNGAVFPKLMAVPLGGFGGSNSKAAAQAKAYAGERMGKAKWLIGALEQRAKSTLMVARAIVAAQRQFLEAGKEFMVPLTLKQIADEVGVHESTVSRVVSGKYMLTPQGMVAMKAFFASGVASTGGTVGVASSSVQALIAKLVRGEDPKKPFSDEQLVLRLKDEGVEVARRTVAKYRGILQIPGTAERRVRA